MIIFKGKTFAKVYKDSLRALVNRGQEIYPRGQVCRELLDVALVIEDPQSCMYTNNIRSSQFKYIAAEYLWYYMGRSDVEFISKYAKLWSNIQNEDGTANSAYGNLIFNIENKHNITQYNWAIQSLLADINTRQAIMHFNMLRHQYFDNKDFVCTMYVNLHIRNNKLYMKVNMRSNDAIYGTPTDIAFFASLQIQILAHLRTKYPNLELGTYTHVADSYHIYERHYNLVDRMLDNSFRSIKLPPLVSNLINISGKPTSSLLTLFNYIEKGEPEFLIFQDGNDIYKWIYDNLIDKN